MWANGCRRHGGGQMHARRWGRRLVGAEAAWGCWGACHGAAGGASSVPNGPFQRKRPWQDAPRLLLRPNSSAPRMLLAPSSVQIAAHRSLPFLLHNPQIPRTWTPPTREGGGRGLAAADGAGSCEGRPSWGRRTWGGRARTLGGRAS